MSAQSELARLALAALAPSERAALFKQFAVEAPRRRLGTRRDAAAILGIHPGSIQRYTKRGLVEPIWITCRRVRFDLDQVEKLANYGAAAKVPS